MTRAARRQQPTQWTRLPVLAKIFKLIIYEMTNSLDALAQGNEEFDDEDEDDDDEDTTDTEDLEDGGGDNVNGKMTDLSKLLDPAYSAYFEDEHDDEEDPDVRADPMYGLNLKQYLTEFLHDFCKQPYFHPHFSQHLNDVERGSLKAIGIAVL